MEHRAPSTRLLVQVPEGQLVAERWSTGPDRAVVLLVHGYPDNRRTWEPLARLLCDQFDVVAYDVRGAGESFTPTSRAAYRLDRLAADLIAVIDAVSPTRAVHLVGHDWGSVQGWEMATDPSQKGQIASFTSCSGPCFDHVAYWQRDRLRHPTWANLSQVGVQALKSWYLFLFRLPVLPEVLWRLWLGPHWSRFIQRTEGIDIESHPTRTQDGINGLGLYRANGFHPRMLACPRYAHCPVLLLVPTRDRFVSPALSRDLARWVPQLTRNEIAGGHWVTIEQPALVARHVRAFIGTVGA